MAGNLLSDFLILGLAVWRLASLLVNESGPFDILGRFRTWIGVYYDENSVAQGKNQVAEAFTCVWCLSVWIGVATTLVYFISRLLALTLSFPLALSALAILIQIVVDKNDP